MQSNKYNSRYSLSLRAAAEARTDGRGTDNTSAKACSKLGYKVVEASTTSKFVEVRGAQGSALVGFYAGFGGFQVEVGSAALAEELAESTGTDLAPRSNGRRIAIGFSERKLGEVLAIVTGGPVAEAKVAAEVPVASVKAPVVVTEDEEIAALEAALAAKQAKAARIAELKAQLAALES